MKKALIFLSMIVMSVTAMERNNEDYRETKSGLRSGLHSRNNSIGSASSYETVITQQPTRTGNFDSNVTQNTPAGDCKHISEKTKAAAFLGILGGIGLGECLIIATNMFF